MDGSYFGAVRGSISGHMADCVSAFDSLSGELGSVRSALVDIGGQLTGLVAFLAPAEADNDPIARLLSAARALSVALSGWSDPTTESNILPALSKGIRHLDLIEREARMLLSVAALTRVVSADGRLSDLEDYVRSLRDMAGKIAEESLATRAGLRQTQQEFQRSSAAILAARRAIDGVSLRIAEGDAVMRKLADTLAEDSARLRRTAEAFPMAAARGTAGLIACIQFSDILAQRLDHVQQILGLSQEAGSAGAAGLVDLAVAQIDACGTDAEEVLDRAASALSGLLKDGQSALHAFTGQGGRGAAEALNERRRAELSRLETVSDSARDASLLATDLAGGMENRLSDGLRSTASLDRATYEINLSALNATLLSARQSQSREALKVLSGAVRESAAVCAENSRSCRTAIEGCANEVRDGRIDRIREGAEAFRLALDSARAGLEQAREEARQLAGMRDTAQQALTRLIDATEGGQAALMQVERAVEAIRETGGALVATDGATRMIPPELLSRAEALYTMEREREVHRTFMMSPRLSQGLG